MEQELPLIPERSALLEWLSKQPEPVSLQDMRTMNAPCYEELRVEQMVADGLINRSLDVRGGVGTVGVYWISDKGTAALSAAKEMADERAQRDRAQALQEEQAAQQNKLAELQAQLMQTQNRLAKTQNRLLLAQIIVAAVSFLIGLVVEHWTGLVGWFLNLFS